MLIADAAGDVGSDLTGDEWLDAKGGYLTIGRIIARGVRVAESGFESPVVFPGLIGAFAPAARSGLDE